jgi:spore photoproduct lyase
MNLKISRSPGKAIGEQMHKINQVLIEKGADKYKFGSKILEITENLTVATAGSENSQVSNITDMDKETLRLVPFKGELMKPCPGTKEYICCGYQILNVGTNCPMDCSYCILQTYVNQPSLRVFTNIEDELPGIFKAIDRQPDKLFRIGTGEFTDSLALDPVTQWSQLLPTYFEKRKNVILELKTKTDNIEGLLKNRSRDRVVVSWSLNSPTVSSKEEKGAISIEKRLKAAKECQKEGYAVGFHFDPLIYHKDWKKGYRKTVELMDQYIDPNGVIWISLGCLRYMPGLKHIIRKRHPETHILDSEFINGLDGKKRYFKPVRIEMYSYMKGLLQESGNDHGLYLCMESNEIWQESLGWSPGDSDGLSAFLDRRVEKILDNRIRDI